MSDDKTKVTTPPPPPSKATSSTPPPSTAPQGSGAQGGDLESKNLDLAKVEVKKEVLTSKVKNLGQIPIRIGGVIDIVESETSTVRQGVSIEIAPGATVDIPNALFTLPQVMELRKSGELILVK